MKRKRSCLGQPLLWPQPSDIAECFFWLPFFQGSGSCLASPTGCCSHLLPHNKFWLITARKKWVLWKYLHSPLVLLGSIIKKRLAGPTFPSPESYMVYPQQSYLSVDFLATTMCPPSIKSRSGSSMIIYLVGGLAELSQAQLHMYFGFVCVQIYVYSNWLF